MPWPRPVSCVADAAPCGYTDATVVDVAKVATRELRNDTAGVLRRVQAGEEIVITVNGEPVAALVPIAHERRRGIPKVELLELLRTSRADPGLRDELRELAGGPDDLPPIV